MKKIFTVVVIAMLLAVLTIPVAEAQYSDYEPPVEWITPPPVTASPAYTG